MAAAAPRHAAVPGRRDGRRARSRRARTGIAREAHVRATAMGRLWNNGTMGIPGRSMNETGIPARKDLAPQMPAAAAATRTMRSARVGPLDIVLDISSLRRG